MINLDINVSKGLQLVLGGLRFTGLTPADQTKAVKLWQLRDGPHCTGRMLMTICEGCSRR